VPVTPDIDWGGVLSCREFWLLYYELAIDWNSAQGRKAWGINPRTERTLLALRELLRGREIPIPLPGGYTLAVALQTGASHRLYLVRSRQRQLLGWVDAHFHPDVFRADEFRRIVSAAGSVPDGRLPPAAMYLLLFQYVGISAADDLRTLAREFKQAFHDIGVFSAREVNRFAAWLSVPGTRFTELVWVADSRHGWVVEGGYSLRSLEPEYDFDFGAFLRFIRDYGG
jgi:hypothetical protein